MADRYTVLAIDPGMNNLGYSFSIFNQDTQIVVDYGTVQPSSYEKPIRSRRRYFSDRVMTGRIISKLIVELIDTFHPDFLCSEDAFYNPSRPTAYTSLLIAIYAIESVLYLKYEDGDYEDIHETLLYKIPPKLIKKIFAYDAEAGKSTKMDMFEALKKHVASGETCFMNQVRYELPSIDTFTEHSVDSIGVAYCFSKVWIPIIDEKILPIRETSFTKSIRAHLKKKKYKTQYFTP